MGKPRRNVALEQAVRRHGEGLAVASVVVVEDLLETLLLERRALGVVDVWIHLRGHLQVRGQLLEQPIVRNGLRDAARGEKTVEPPANAARRPPFNDVVHHGPAVPVTVVLATGHIVLDAPHVRTIGSHISRHGNVFEIPQVHDLLCRVDEHLFLRVRLCLLEPHHAAQVGIPEGHDHVRVKAQHIAVADAVSDAVAMQLIAEHHGRGREALLVLFVDGRAGEPKEHRAGKRPLDLCEHVAKGRAMALVDDEHNALVLQGGKIVL